MVAATLTSKGQITLPIEIRKRYGLRAGDTLEFLMEEQGAILMVPKNMHAKDLIGMLPRPKKPKSLAAMNQAVRKRGGKS